MAATDLQEVLFRFRWGFPKIRSTLLGVPIIRINSILGSILGSPYLGKLPDETTEAECRHAVSQPPTAILQVSMQIVEWPVAPREGTPISQFVECPLRRGPLQQIPRGQHADQTARWGFATCCWHFISLCYAYLWGLFDRR